MKADPELSEPERDRLELFLKITANATAYGSLARFDRRDLDTAIPVSVHGPDPDPRTETIKTPEDPGPFCFPPVACTITAGARLMLAILERLVTDAGGTYAFCDTDSMAIIATPDGGDVPCATEHGDAVNALSYNTVRSILDSFKRLSPYDPALLEPWKVEHDSLDRQLYCYAISAKRYALYRTDPHGEPELVSVHDGEDEPDDERTEAIEPLTDWSEHGLGLYLDPLPRINGRPQLDQRRRRLWMRQAWQSILADAHGAPTDPPSWTDQYALARFTLSRPTLADWFSGYDKSRPREERVRPGSFGLLAHPNTLIHGPHPQRLPAAPYETAAGLWPTLPWFDRATGDPLIVITGAARRQSVRFAQQLTDGAVVVDTLGEILGRYTRRPEHKSLAPNREPAGHETAGLLARRPLTSTPAKTRLIGKEGTKLLERLTGPQLDRVNERDDYGTRTDPWATLIHPVLRDAGAAILIAHGIPRSTAFATLRGATRPRQHYDLYLQAVSAHARACLAAWGLPAAGDPLGQLAQYVRERDRRGENVRRCEWCGEPLPAAARADARYHGDACRQAARRGRANRSD